MPQSDPNPATPLNPQADGPTFRHPLAAGFEPVITLDDDHESDDGRLFLFDERFNLVLVDEEVPLVSDPTIAPFMSPDGLDTGESGRHLLGTLGSVPQWTALIEPEGPMGGVLAHPGASLVDLRSAFGALAEPDWVLAGRAAQILRWDREHRFCGRCGRPTSPHATERARRCDGCGLMAFPRLTPAVIMLVEHHDGRALLAWGRQFPGRFFSTLAGFVEPGESLEHAVVREVKEETGIDVTNVRYFGSQPWPFPHSLMIGFQADYVGGDLKIQESEIVEAGWFGPDDLPPVPRGTMSIAAWLIEDWLERTGA